MRGAGLLVCWSSLNSSNPCSNAQEIKFTKKAATAIKLTLSTSCPASYLIRPTNPAAISATIATKIYAACSLANESLLAFQSFKDLTISLYILLLYH